MDGGAERDRRRDARRRDHPQSSRDHRGAGERPRRPLGQCGADRGGRSRRPPRQARAVPAGGLLLQDFPLAAVGDFRGRDPRHGRPRPGRRRQSSAADNPQINARCDLLVIGAGAAGLAAANAAARRGAQGFPRRRPSRDRRPARPSRRDDRRRRLARMGGERHQDGRSRRRPRDDANHGLWRLRRQSRLRLGAADAAARRALAHPAKANRGRGRRDRAAAHRPRQRPAGRDVGRRRARLSPPIRGPRRQAHCRRDQQRQRLCRSRGFGRGRRGGRNSRHPRRRACHAS